MNPSPRPFPRSFLARTEAESGRWREEFIRSFLERDIPQLGLRLPAPALRRYYERIAPDSDPLLSRGLVGEAFRDPAGLRGPPSTPQASRKAWTISTHSRTPLPAASRTISGDWGRSYGASTPVNWVIFPASALA